MFREAPVGIATIFTTKQLEVPNSGNIYRYKKNLAKFLGLYYSQ